MQISGHCSLVSFCSQEPRILWRQAAHEALRLAGLGCGATPSGVVGQAAPDKHNNGRADGRTDEGGALVEPVSSDKGGDDGGDKCASDTEQVRESAVHGVVIRDRVQQASNDAGHKTNNDGRDDIQNAGE
jgi:hypothetical protein